MASKMQTMAGGMSKVSSGLIGLTFIAGSLVQSMNHLSDNQKEQVSAGMNVVGAYGAVGAELLSMGLEFAATAAVAVALLGAKMQEIAASTVCCCGHSAGLWRCCTLRLEQILRPLALRWQKLEQIQL
jgi:hypothetical protein